MADRWDVTLVGPGSAPEKWLLRVGVVGLLIAAPGAAVGYFEGFQDGTEAGGFAWVMTFLGGLLMGVAALVGVVRWLDPESRRERRRRTAIRRSRQAPLAASEFTYEALLEAAVRSTGAPLRPQPPAPLTDSRGRLVWWRNLDLLTAFDLPYKAAGSVGGALVGFGGVLHVFGEAGRGWFFLVLSVGKLCLLAFVFDARLAHGFARRATSEHVQPMRWLLLREPDAGEAYLVLYRAEDDPDEAPPMLLRIAKKRQARRLPPAGVADVHGLLASVTVLVPWIDGSPVWTRHPVITLDLTNPSVTEGG